MCICVQIVAAVAAAKMIFISVHNIIAAFKASKNGGIFPSVCVCVCIGLCLCVQSRTVILFDVVCLQLREKLQDLPLKSALQRRTEHMLCSVGSLQSTIAKPPCGITLRRLVSAHCQTLTQTNSHKLYFRSLFDFLTSPLIN